jgi:hypothetical protein
MYKITVHGKTFVGNNEDSWRQTSGIWFEQGKAGALGAAYVGYAEKPFPEGGMNEAGLVYDAFTMLSKDHLPPRDPGKQDFFYDQLKTILRQCRTVDDVYAYLSRLNLHLLNGSPLFYGGMILFADRTGMYLTVEADTMVIGRDESFLLANFSHAQTTDRSAIKMERYCNGVSFLKEHQPDTGIAFLSGLSRSMSVNREKVGDGTLYTTIYDTHEGLIYTYFFHNYDTCIVWNLQEELGKGDHGFLFPELFAGNKAYQAFLTYRTPQNNRFLFWLLILFSGLFLISSVCFTGSFMKHVKPGVAGWSPEKSMLLMLSLLCPALCYYMYVLLRNQDIFYFPSPYASRNIILSLAAYLPFVVVLALPVLLAGSIHILKQAIWNRWSMWLLALNDLAMLALVALFTYWQLFGF